MAQKLLRQIEITKNKIQQLNDEINQIAEYESHFIPSQDDAQISDISRKLHVIFGSFQVSIGNVQEMIDILTNLRDEAIASQSNELRLPTIDKVKQMLKDFFNGKIKLKSPPLPEYCGCYAYKNKDTKEGDFICARIISSDQKPHYYLYIVAKYSQNICEAYDPEKDDIEMKLISLKDGEWTPLPTIIPERPLKRWEHSKDTQVLSLFQEDGEWTTEFYPAKVVQNPYQRQNADVRGYELEFEGSSAMHVVPENFLVSYLKPWIEADKKLV